MRDILFKSVSIIVIISLLIVLFFGIYIASTRHDEKLWNNGHCDVCGGVWRYEQAIGHRYSTSYIYVCEDCGKRIELDRIFDIYKSIQQGRK